MKELIKKTLKSNAIGRAIYPQLNKLYRLYSVPMRQKRLKRVGYNVLSEIFTIAKNENINIIPIFGTLLGFIRDNGFIHNDDDIDIAIPAGIAPQKVLSVFVEKYGYTYSHGFSYHGKCTEFTLKHKSGLTIDFFFFTEFEKDIRLAVYYWKNDIQYNDARQNSVRWVAHPPIVEYTPYIINGVEITIPVNYEEILYAEYGNGWRVYDPNYVGGKNQPGRILLNDFGYKVTYEEILKDNLPK